MEDFIIKLEGLIEKGYPTKIGREDASNAGVALHLEQVQTPPAEKKDEYVNICNCSTVIIPQINIIYTMCIITHFHLIRAGCVLNDNNFLRHY